MNSDELFEKLPQLLFTSFRKQLLLGMVPAQTVQTVLEPLLSNFYELMVDLPSDLQNDFKNILMIYPDVARQFGLRMKPALPVFLHELAENLADDALQQESEMDLAAEPQKRLSSSKNYYCVEGQGFFTTDSGNCVSLEVAYTEPDGSVSFEYRPSRFAIDLHICGRYAMTLTPGEPAKKLPVGKLAEILKKCIQGVVIQVSEA